MTYQFEQPAPRKRRTGLAWLLGGLVLVVAVVLVLVFTLGGGDGSREVIDQSIKAVNAGDFDRLKQLQCPGTDSRDTLQRAADDFLNAEYDMTETGAVQEQDDYARVPVKLTVRRSILGNQISDHKNTEIRAKYQDDRWCVVDPGLSG